MHLNLPRPSATAIVSSIKNKTAQKGLKASCKHKLLLGTLWF